MAVLLRFAVILIPLVFAISFTTKGDLLRSFLFALSVGVGLIPEMLPMVVNACLAHGASVMGKKQTVVKNINAMQSFASLDVLCVDKTGTLTEDKILLEYYMDILGNENQQVLEYAYLNSLYHSGVKNHLDSGILEVKGWESFDAASLEEKYKKIDSLPFDYQRKIATETDLTLLGFLAFFDAPKQSAFSAIEKLKAKNVSVRVLSGDKKNVTQSICRRLKLNTENMLTGTDLTTMDENQILQRIETTEVFAELTPEQKSFVVRILQQNGHTVGFLGDGLNDLSAISQCDAGIAWKIPWLH